MKLVNVKPGTRHYVFVAIPIHVMDLKHIEIPVIKPKNYDSIGMTKKSKSSLKEASSTKVVDEENIDEPKGKKAVKSKN